MKFKDIKKMTSCGSYEINVGFEYLKDWVDRQQHKEEMGETASLDLNPDFQRGHVWSEQQQINFMEFLLRGGNTNPIYFNCVGWMNDFEGPFVIVDGLQRLTACLRFINNEIKVFGHYLNEFEDSLRINGVDLKININNLKTRKEVLQWYIDLNTGGTVHTNEEIEKVKKMLKKEK